jgi:hypothetical protein
MWIPNTTPHLQLHFSQLVSFNLTQGTRTFKARMPPLSKGAIPWQSHAHYANQHELKLKITDAKQEEQSVQ